MPYQTNAQLPAPLQTHLPAHAQDIYREAFNHAYAANAGEADRDRHAHMIAWAAIKRRFEKGSNGQWVEREPTEMAWFEHHV